MKIDGDELIRLLQRQLRVASNDYELGHNCGISTAIQIVSKSSTECKKGEWIDKGDYCVCNQCGHTEQQFNGIESTPLHTPFCAMCGADMRME